MGPHNQIDAPGLSNRQSLPPISEVFQSIKLSDQPGSSMSSSSVATARAFPETEEHHLPQPAHHISTLHPRPGIPPGISNSTHYSWDGTYPQAPPSTPVGTVHQAERLHHFNGMHPSMFAVYPEHGTPSGHPEQSCFRAPLRTEQLDCDAQARHKAMIDWCSEHWSYEESLSEIMSLTRTISGFAEVNTNITSRQQTARIIPDQLPSEREVNEMLGNLEHVKQLLVQVKDLQNAIRPKRAQPGTKLLRRHQEHVMDISNGTMRPQYVITDVTE